VVVQIRPFIQGHLSLSRIREEIIRGSSFIILCYRRKQAGWRYTGRNLFHAIVPREIVYHAIS